MSQGEIHLHSEFDVTVKVVVPKLHGLGYTDLRLEHPLRPGRADVVVFVEGVPIIVVECKAPRVRLSDDHFHQVMGYAGRLSAPFAALCNGQRWQYFCGRTGDELIELPLYGGEEVTAFFHRLNETRRRESQAVAAQKRRDNEAQLMRAFFAWILMVALSASVLFAIGKYLRGQTPRSLQSGTGPMGRTPDHAPPGPEASAGRLPPTTRIAAESGSSGGELDTAQPEASTGTPLETKWLPPVGRFLRVAGPQAELTIRKSFDVGDRYRVMGHADGIGSDNSRELDFTATLEGEQLSFEEPTESAFQTHRVVITFIEEGLRVTDEGGSGLEGAGASFEGKYERGGK